MINPQIDGTPPNPWLADLDQAVQLALGDCNDEATSILRALDEALRGDDRTEILAQFDSAIVLFAREKHWREGMWAARRVYDIVRTWLDFESSAYARTLAQFTFNHALEFQQDHVLGAAEDLLREAVRLFEECGDTAGGIRSEHELGRALQEGRELRKAEQCYLSSLRSSRLLGDRNYVCRNLLQLGQVAQLDGDLDSSADYYNETLALAEEINNDLCAIAASHQLGLIAYTRGDYVTAADRFHSALARAEKINDARSAADALHQLGMIAHKQGDYGLATELYHASLSKADQGVDIVPTLYQLAQAAYACDDLPSTEGYARQSLSLAQAQGNLDSIRRVQNFLQYLAQVHAVATCLFVARSK